MGIQVRKLLEKDLEQCLELLKQLTFVGDINTFEYKEIYRNLPDTTHIFVAIDEENEKVVGMSTILIEQKFIHHGGKAGHIEDVVVDSNYRNKGIGKMLINKCIETGNNYKCYKIILDCDDEKSGFYQKSGFKKRGIFMRLTCNI